MDEQRFLPGFGWGVVATPAMSVLMIAAVLRGMSPTPKPIPAAIVGKLTGGALSQPATMAVAALVLHLVYGATYGWLMGRRETAVGDGGAASTWVAP